MQHVVEDTEKVEGDKEREGRQPDSMLCLSCRSCNYAASRFTKACALWLLGILGDFIVIFQKHLFRAKI